MLREHVAPLPGPIRPRYSGKLLVVSQIEMKMCRILCSAVYFVVWMDPKTLDSESEQGGVSSLRCHDPSGAVPQLASRSIDEV